MTEQEKQDLNNSKEQIRWICVAFILGALFGITLITLLAKTLL